MNPVQRRSALARVRDAKYVVLSGGGTKGIAMAEAWRTLCGAHPTLQQQIIGVAGTSIGGYIALGIASGVSPDAISRLISAEDTWDIDRLGAEESILLTIHQKFGLLSSDLLQSMVGKMLQVADLPQDITFEQHFARTKRELICNACCIYSNEMLLMSHRTTPRMSVRLAVVMTMCYPLAFQAVEYQNKMWVDGGVFCNFLFQESGFPLHNTLGIHCPRPHVLRRSNKPNIFTWMTAFVYACGVRVEKAQFERLTRDQKQSIVTMYIPGIETEEVSGLRFEANHVEHLQRCGRESAVWFLYRGEVIKRLLWKQVRWVNATQKRAASTVPAVAAAAAATERQLATPLAQQETPLGQETLEAEVATLVLASKSTPEDKEQKEQTHTVAKPAGDTGAAAAEIGQVGVPRQAEQEEVQERQQGQERRQLE